ncbi:chitin deacetylase 8-like [Pararge aegeria]|uniref:Jg7868 protein n=1 Tax=Pararge aegeria aegeria TaxID=348720 RepID=A0A8S4S4Q4_9NEOP|nr:chitin deacetylase 8-like [Pararge aegeria]CAH2244914.1 jg7868 [Pararge aegeria aegeria]
MKFVLTVISVVSAFAYVQANLPAAAPCNETLCSLPHCRCSTTNIPGGLAPNNTPQFVLLTFDDGVNVNNIILYRQLLRNRVNSNRCRAAATFFVTHEYTDYTLVNELYNEGHEIALHSISHQVSMEYWRDANVNTMMREIGDQRSQVAHFANIPVNTVHGVRLPFLQMSGNSSFQMMASSGLTYDSSWPTNKYLDPGLWPYTLNFRSTQDCIIPPCPTGSIPGPWVIPMVSWIDLQGLPCAMVDTCYHHPHGADEEGWYRFILQNFERHYNGNRAPFGFYVHEWFVRVNPGLRFALERFLNMINNLNDAFMVNAKEVTDWVQNPVSVNVYRQRSCRNPLRTQCSPNFCGPLRSPIADKNYYMQICTRCPRVYPWVNNPLGL